MAVLWLLGVPYWDTSLPVLLMAPLPTVPGVYPAPVGRAYWRGRHSPGGQWSQPEHWVRLAGAAEVPVGLVDPLERPAVGPGLCGAGCGWSRESWWRERPRLPVALCPSNRAPPYLECPREPRCWSLGVSQRLCLRCGLPEERAPSLRAGRDQGGQGPPVSPQHGNAQSVSSPGAVGRTPRPGSGFACFTLTKTFLHDLSHFTGEGPEAGEAGGLRTACSRRGLSRLCLADAGPCGKFSESHSCPRTQDRLPCAGLGAGHGRFGASNMGLGEHVHMFSYYTILRKKC